MLSEDTAIFEAARCMGQWHVGSIVVIRDDEPVGLVTDRDLMLHGILKARGEESIRECMSVPLVAIEKSASVHDAVEVMRVKGIRRLGIRSGDGVLVGLVTADDFWRHLGSSMGCLAKTIQRELRVEEHPTGGKQPVLGKE